MNRKSLTSRSRERHPLARKTDLLSLDDLQHQVGELLESMWEKIGRHHQAVSGRAHMPVADLSESDKALEITIDLPGVVEKDIEVLVSENSITVQGEKKVARERKGWNYYASERVYGSFRRSFSLPPDANSDKTKASFDNGVLTISVPKKPGTRKLEKAVPITVLSKPKTKTKSRPKIRTK